LKLSYPVVLVKWLDAYNAGIPVSDVELKGLPEGIYVESVGFLVDENKDRLVIGYMIYPDEESVKHYQVIPKKMILKVVKVAGVVRDV